MMSALHCKIESLRTIMMVTAEQHSNDLLHPDVIRVSRELDVLINEAMQEQQPPNDRSRRPCAAYQQVAYA